MSWITPTRQVTTITQISLHGTSMSGYYPRWFKQTRTHFTTVDRHTVAKGNPLLTARSAISTNVCPAVRINCHLLLTWSFRECMARVSRTVAQLGYTIRSLCLRIRNVSYPFFCKLQIVDLLVSGKDIPIFAQWITGWTATSLNDSHSQGTTLSTSHNL